MLIAILQKNPIQKIRRLEPGTSTKNFHEYRIKGRSRASHAGEFLNQLVGRLLRSSPANNPLPVSLKTEF
ncbi:hypothetical protein ACQ4M4_02520 [Leptolyngbya sp. AN02str]|uniref:hypothetical protein n=1 Tax=Leptolyngbya sp. AN02str TaxID=3423363 RepID=UPI003D321CA4